MSTTQDTDWKAIAMALGQRVNFAIQYCDCKGGGLMDFETGKVTSWRNYMAEGLEMIPGVVIDRERLSAMSLPPAKREKALAKINAQRNAEKVQP